MIALTNGTGLGMMASETERTKIDDEGPESCCSDAAQQLSASACVMTRAEPESSEPALCIGQDPPSEQQAMRASGVASHPAHTATLLAARARIMRTADTGLPKLATVLRMLERHESVKHEPAGVRLPLPHVRGQADTAAQVPERISPSE